MKPTPSSLDAPPSRLGQALANARGQGRAALAAYLPAGYPTLGQSLDALHLLSTTADVIEIGLPYTDPLMDGPVIQHAAAQALRAGFRTEHLFTTVHELAAASNTALVVMTYWQPVHHFGPTYAKEIQMSQE